MSTVPVNANMAVAGSLTAGVLRHKGDMAHNVKAYGAVGDGTTNDQPAIQAAIDACKDANQLPTDSGGFTTAGIIEIPPGSYRLNTPLQVFSGQTLRGVGPASHLVQGAGWSGAALVVLSASGGYYSHGQVEDLTFDGATATAIANAATTRTLNSTFQRLILNTQYGVRLTYYTQFCTIADLYSFGPVDTIVHLKGNFNFLRMIDKEGGGTGTSTEPYILIEAHGFGAYYSDGNVLEKILIEGVGSANKTLIRLNETGDTHLRDLWFETSTADGYALRILDSDGKTTVAGLLHGLAPHQKIQVSNSREVLFERLDVNSADTPWSARLEVDSTSQVTIGSLKSRTGGSVTPVATLANIRILESTVASAYGQQPSYVGSSAPPRGTVRNLLTNPSFESSGTGWTITGSPSTAEYIASEVGPGLMAHYGYGSVQASVTLTQSVTIPAAWVGKPLVLSALLKVTTATGYAHPYLSGAGITAQVYNYLDGGLGWGLVQQAFRPQSAGTLTVGIRALSVDDFAVDAVSLTLGPDGLAHVL